MAPTTLDPVTALIVVDLQRGLMGPTFIHPIADVVTRACAKPRRQRSGGIVCRSPSSMSTAQRPAAPSGHATFKNFPTAGPTCSRNSAVNPATSSITKRTWGAFASSDLEDQLRRRGVTQVVVSGVATGTGVESTARQAYEAGFNVTLAIDAMTDARPEAHDYSIANVFPRLGETGMTQAIIDLPQKDPSK